VRPVPVQERLRGRRCSGWLIGRRGGGGGFEGVVDGGPVRGTVAVVAMSYPRTSQHRWDIAAVFGVVR
jgi:hypothetical protein